MAPRQPVCMLPRASTTSTSPSWVAMTADQRADLFSCSSSACPAMTSSRLAMKLRVTAVPAALSPGVKATGPVSEWRRMPHTSRRAELMVAVPKSRNG